VSGDDVGRQHHVTFQSLRHVDEDGMECWLARELMALLECATGGKSKRVVLQATMGDLRATSPVNDHVSQAGNMIEIGQGVPRKARVLLSPALLADRPEWRAQQAGDRQCGGTTSSRPTRRCSTSRETACAARRCCAWLFRGTTVHGRVSSLVARA